MQPAVFLDKDGTLVDDIPYNVDPDKLVLAAGVRRGVQRLDAAGYALVVVTNQSGVARGLFAEAALAAVEDRLKQLLAVPLAGFYYCPHHLQGTVLEYARPCGCRKPAPGLLLQAAADHDLDLPHSWMVGDILNDIEAGHRAGCRSVLIDNGNETEWALTPMRTPRIRAPNFAQAVEGLLAAA